MNNTPFHIVKVHRLPAKSLSVHRVAALEYDLEMLKGKIWFLEYDLKHKQLTELERLDKLAARLAAIDRIQAIRRELGI